MPLITLEFSLFLPHLVLVHVLFHPKTRPRRPQKRERALSIFAAKASAKAVSLEKSYVFGFGFCALKPLLKEKPNRCF